MSKVRAPRRTFIQEDVCIVVCLGDLVSEDTDAIVCPANSYAYMRGGVAGAIRTRGGNTIEDEARAHAPIRIGRAVSTGGGSLRTKYVFHAPTMKEPVEVAQPPNVTAAMNASLDLAWSKRIQSISFPGMGTGTGALPYFEAARIMVQAIRDAIKRPHTIRRVHLIAKSEEMYRAFIASLEKELGQGSSQTC